jgi:3-isopropylmalate/(R)-2-methylmalate dehydratase large subunit
MATNTFFNNVWNAHKIGELPSGQDHIYVGKHVGHEVTSPPAFEGIREEGLDVRRKDLTFFVLDHVIPTKADQRKRPFEDPKAEAMASQLEQNVKEFNLKFFGPDAENHGVCHVVYPEMGVIWPGSLVVCGDSHTCTYGALGALAFGIGTTEVGHVLATQSLGMEPVKVRRINLTGKLQPGVTAKDAALHTITTLGVNGGIGFAYEFGGDVVDAMSIEARMTLCNMAVEGNARVCYMNPDEKTFEWLKGRPFAPKEDFYKLVDFALSMRSGKDAKYDSIVDIDASKIQPMVTWGTNPEQAIPITGRTPVTADDFSPEQRMAATGESELYSALRAYEYMGILPGQSMLGMPIDYVFIGSCTNGRIEDLEAAASVLKGNFVNDRVTAIAVPGSYLVKQQAEERGLDKIFKKAGFQWREPGCSMCLSMSPDLLAAGQRSLSTSNRPFEGRQGPGGRTHLGSPYTAAATAIEGKIANPMGYIRGEI